MPFAFSVFFLQIYVLDLFCFFSTLFLTLKILCFCLLHFGSSLWLNSPLWFYSSINLQVFKGLSSPHCKSRTESHMSIPRRNTKNGIVLIFFRFRLGHAELPSGRPRQVDPSHSGNTRFYCSKLCCDKLKCPFGSLKDNTGIKRT